MNLSIRTRKWFVILQYIGLPILLLLSVVSRPPGVSEYASVLIAMGILLLWAISSIALSEINYRHAESAKKQQEQFTVDISHDLRTPTAALRTLLEVSQLDPKLSSHTPSQQVFARALIQVDSISSITDRLLRLSRLETAYIPRLQPVQLSSTIIKVIDLLEPLAHSKKQSVIIDIDKSIYVYAIPDELTQLYVVFLDNAIKFSPHESTIHIVANIQRSYVMISIRDNGIGLSSQEQKNIFDRFYRTDSARQKTATTSGFGLGLAIASIIATRHKTKIIVTSAPQKGATFTIRLKRAKAPDFLEL